MTNNIVLHVLNKNLVKDDLVSTVYFDFKELKRLQVGSGHRSPVLLQITVLLLIPVFRWSKWCLKVFLCRTPRGMSSLV